MIINRFFKNIFYRYDSEIEKIINYNFKNKHYLSQALTHKSISNNPGKSYERLEFLGDAVIDIIVSEKLMNEYPECDEGILTQKRSALVQKSFLSYVGKFLNILNYIKIEDNVDLSQEKIADKQYANLFEALVGAIYLDSGFENSKLFVSNTLWKNREKAWSSTNYKGQLIEICHIRQLSNPIFQVSNVTGPDHQKLFEVNVLIGKKRYRSGIGSSKKTAEQQAAEYAIESLTINR